MLILQIYVFIVCVSEISGSASEVVDTVLQYLRVNPVAQSEYDQLLLRDNIRIDEYGQLYDITIDNLLNLHRRGDVVLNSSNMEMTLEAQLALTDLEISTLYRYDTEWYSLSGKVALRVPSVAVSFEARVQNISRPSLDSFELSDLSNPEVISFSGAGDPFNWLVKKIANQIIDTNGELIKNEIEDFAKISFDKMFSK